ncbi:MAG: PadR family transcriptional regulator [Gemmatimonadetes bacterium]|nr:PadR family transcriptional regulator [Gemmatimonadota bacterium]NIU30555.1 PadR family transcriptional regulator [Gemmatimonadota bacterium]NIU35396.1 PadR family transcriptional regulator [Gemmatimonadota bacterium]NIV60925.1 PadR family transcriptional regulator [Gemmatimonadota bacterium]NIV85231.1 PadR family transcriptional regulator [Gemmatimonadota bacterium]
MSVASAPRYGSAIQEDVRDLSDGRVRLWPATLYGSLEELTEKGWLEELAEDEVPEGGAGRERFYRISAKGRKALRDEVERMEGLAGVARARLEGPVGG